MLKDIAIKAVYNSEEDNILNDFYIPALENSVTYDRAVGYFDAKMLTTAARGIASFIQNDGYMRLIVGATLTEDEYFAIEAGYNERKDIHHKIEKRFEEIINSSDDPLFKHQLGALTWLIKNGRLDIKIALRRHGIHHQKIGIMKDANGDYVVFQGSANETNNALNPFNYEVINVFKGWQPEFQEHFEPHVKSFEKLWSNSAQNTLVLNISDIARNALEKKCPNVERPSIKDEVDLWQKHFNEKDNSPKYETPSNIPTVPATLYGQPFQLRPHQKKALESWQKNNFRGVFELATGAGKTITAIYGATKVFESRKRLIVVISAPYQSLADQWEDNLRLFNIRPIVCYGGESNWRADLQENLLLFETGAIKFLAVVVVDATLSSRTGTFYEAIQSTGAAYGDYFLFIGDECHHHGAEAISNFLPAAAELRIGLSATPDRSGDDYGNSLIQKYYGEVVHSYTLQDALNDKVLTPYEYHLVPVELTVTEANAYIEITKKISRIFAMAQSNGDGIGNTSNLNILLAQRAKIINGCQNKPVALENLLKTLPVIPHSLFYCAEGTVNEEEAEEDQEGVRQIQLISRILHKFNWRSSQFTAREKKPQREQILQSFKQQEIDALVAMKCLDEGVDIPACSTAFILSSSKNPRQFIQRRGRILRKSPGKTKAVIYDFFTTLPMDDISDKAAARKLIISELSRINEFSTLALNKGETYKTLEDYLKKYDLVHYLA